MFKPSLSRAVLASTVFAVLLGASGVSSAFSDDEARRAILDLREKLNVTQSSQLELLSRIDQLQEQNAEMTGKVEKLTHQIGLTQKASRDLFMSLDKRLAALESHVEKDENGQSFTVVPEEKRRYDLALELFSEGSYEESQKLLESLATDYPKSGYMADTLYWLGCAYYVQNKMSDAASAQKKLVAKFPKSSRVPEALLSQAAAEERLGNSTSARSLLNSVIQKYPGTESAKTAEQRLKALGPAPKTAPKKKVSAKK